MSAPEPAAALLGDLVGENGRLQLAYRRALETGGPAAHRWSSVMRELQTALGLVAGLSAGHSEAPTAGERSGEMLPCGRCDGRTSMRIYGQPWHYTCWLAAGCPVAPPADQTPDTRTPEVPDSGDTEVVAAELPADATGGRSGGTDPAELGSQASEAHNRRSGEQVSRGARFELDPAEELHDWSREVRAQVPAATDELCEASLAAWHRAVVSGGESARFVSSPGYTGVAVYEWLSSRHGSMVRPARLESERVLALSEARTTLKVLSFIDPEQVPAEGQAVTEVDVNAQYLAAARSAELGDGEPDELEQINPEWLPQLFKKPGYVQLAAAPDLSDLPITGRLPFADLDAGWWVPNPAARYLQHDHGVTLDVAAAIVWPTKRHGRRLSVWCGLFAEARAKLTAEAAAGDEAAAVALKVLKSVYATFLGGMTRSEKHNDRGTLRPDWHDQYVTQAGVNALRALDKVKNATPFGGMKDAFWFLSPAEAAPFQPEGLTYSEQPGKWHVNRWGPVDERIVAAHRAGRIGTLRKAITQADKARRGQ